MSNHTEILVVGAGIFGATAALELASRGFRVTLLDELMEPHPLAASTDISKVIRVEYGQDAQYMEMVTAAIGGFRTWNTEFEEELYHETGITFFTMDPMTPGGFEFESYQTLLSQGHAVERLGAEDIARRFPAWRKGQYVDGVFNPTGGYAESGRIVTLVTEKAVRMGVQRSYGRLAGLVQKGMRVIGVRLESGDTIMADHVLLATGAWTPTILPELSGFMTITGHPVFHLQVEDPRLFSPPLFATFMADVARTGWYGFPYHPNEKVIKIANHGVGQLIDPINDERVVDASDESSLRSFLATTFPALLDAPIVFTRRCLYCDTRDEHFWIDCHPELDGLSVASGGSGHGFKFAPILGTLIADAVERIPNPWLPRFAWRTLSDRVRGEEAARFHG
jgi:glycine/D-amino acid oxidase-like deaminating enzyme